MSPLDTKAFERYHSAMGYSLYVTVVLQLLVGCGRAPAPDVTPLPVQSALSEPMSSPTTADVETGQTSDVEGHDVQDDASDVAGYDVQDEAGATDECRTALLFDPPSDLASTLERLVLQRAANGKLTVELYGRIPVATRPQLSLIGPVECAVGPKEFDVWTKELATFERCDGTAGGEYALELTLTTLGAPIVLKERFVLKTCTPAQEIKVPFQSLQRVREQIRVGLAAIPASDDRKLTVRVDVGGVPPEQWCLTPGRETLSCDSNFAANAVLRISASRLVALYEGKADPTTLFLTGGLELHGEEDAFGIIGATLLRH